MSRVLANASAIDRNSTDFFPTPPAATHALMTWLETAEWIQPGARVWEPACGQGHMSRVLSERGYNVTSSDKFDDSYASPLIDFLDDVVLSITGVDWVITNPPFKEAEAFIRRAHEMDVPFAMLLKSQYWHSLRRRALFEQTRPAAVLPLTWRPDFHFGTKGGSPTMEVAWTVWHPSHQAGTLYQPIGRIQPREAPAIAPPAQQPTNRSE